MDELIELLKSRIGLDDDEARSATEMILQFLKQRLPAPMANQLESALSGPASEGRKVGSGFQKKSA